MKKIGKRIIPVLLLLLVVILSALQVFRVNAGYGLTVTRVSMGEKVSLQGYKTQVEKAEVYTLEQYAEEYPQVEYMAERAKGFDKYVLVATLQITKQSEDAPPLDLTDFVFRMDNSFNQFDPVEMTELNEWTEAQHLEPGKPFQVKIPYYIAESYFSKKQLADLENVDYRITWGVYPQRYEMCLDKIEKQNEKEAGLKEPTDTETESTDAGDLPEDISDMTGAEAYALLLKSKGLTGDNRCNVGESPTIDGVTYEIKNVRQIHNVSEIPDYHEEWMATEFADLPEYTEEYTRKGEFLRKHHYLLVELDMTNVSEKEKAPTMVATGLVYEESRWSDTPWLKMSSEELYSTGGVITYEGSDSSYIILQPGESKKVYALYDMPLDIDPTGENDTDMDGFPTCLLTEEEADIRNILPLHFWISAGLGGSMEWENKGITFVELDWRPEDGTEN